MNTPIADSSSADDNRIDAGRRQFLRSGLVAASAMVATPLVRTTALAHLAPLEMTETGTDDIPRKPLGKTGEKLSIIGLGGYHLGTMESLESAVRMVDEALDAGINFCDNAWEDKEGKSEKEGKNEKEGKEGKAGKGDNKQRS